MLLTIIFASQAHAFGTGAQGCSGDCTACHSVKKEEAAAAVKTVDPDTVVESVAPSPVGGLYQLTVRKGNATGIVYLDFSKKFIIAGKIIDTGRKVDVTAEKMEELRRIDPRRIPLDNALLLGNRQGQKKLIVFTDPECPFCAKLHEELLALVREEPELQISIVLTPLDIHPDATRKSDVIVCRSQENMEEGLGLLQQSLAGKAVSGTGCGRNYGDEGKKLGRELGIGMTPTMVFGNGKIVSGARKKEEIRKLLEEAEKEAADMNRQGAM